MAGECSSYTRGVPICRDGFPISAACSGYRCHACGAWSPKAPACMREDLGPHLIDDTGLPRLRRLTREADHG